MTAIQVLGFETSGARCGIALTEGEDLIGQIDLRQRMELARRLMPAVDALLRLFDREARNLGGIAVSLGPGSFTGLRVGVATAKTLAWSLGIQIAGVPTLEALA